MGSHGLIGFWEARDLVIVPSEDPAGTSFRFPILWPYCNSVAVAHLVQLHVATIRVISPVFGTAAAAARLLTSKRALAAAKQAASERAHGRLSKGDGAGFGKEDGEGGGGGCDDAGVDFDRAGEQVPREKVSIKRKLLS